MFDFDGTLVDSRRGIVSAIETALAGAGLRSPGDDAVAALIGLPLDEVFTRLAPGANARSLSDRYRAAYHSLAPGMNSLFDGVAAALDRLSKAQVRMAIATSKSRAGTERVAAALGIARYFEAIVAADTVERKKPDPESVTRALALIGADPRETLVVGDTTYDLEMGRRAGVDTCAVTYGMHPRALLEAERPTYFVDAPPGIPPLFDARG